MRRLVIVVPELLHETEPILDCGLPALLALAERSKLYRLSRSERCETPEARFLGLKPSDAELRQGPLTVAAFGADPPARSLHFHLSLLSIIDGVVRSPDPLPNADELRIIIEAARKLNTRAVTLVEGIGVDHGLVWEALGDLATVPAVKLVGHPVHGCLPLGDGEPVLRRYIDDSVNLLGELDLNRRRVDDGHAPLNLLWPWGQGMRLPVPNLPLQRGEPATVTSGSLRLAGLTRLVGYRHRDIAWLGKGLQTRLREAAAEMLTGGNSVLALDSIAEFRQRGELDEAAYFMQRMDAEVLLPILKQAADESLNLLIAAPAGEHDGLALVFNSRRVGHVTYPFDERSIDEPKLARMDLESLVASALTPE
ncbi:MAG: alkaline phosphatase family protein [Fimbriimonadaceae bacterium]